MKAVCPPGHEGGLDLRRAVPEQTACPEVAVGMSGGSSWDGARPSSPWTPPPSRDPLPAPEDAARAHRADRLALAPTLVWPCYHPLL